MSTSAAITELIERYLASSDDRLGWTKDAVRRHDFLSLFLGWVDVLGIRPDGSFVHWRPDDGLDAIQPVELPFWRRMAICQGARTHPARAELIPRRPPEALTCATCRGTGELAGHPDIVCECGGAGWIVPGEANVPTPA